MEQLRLTNGTFGSPYSEPVDEKTLSVKVPLRTFNAVNEAAKKAGISRSQWLRDVAIGLGLESRERAVPSSNRQ